MGKHLLFSEHPLLLFAEVWSCAKQVSAIFMSEFKINRFYDGNRSHCYLEGSLLIIHIYLLLNSKVFTKSSSEYFPRVHLCDQGHLNPEKCEEQARVTKAIPKKGDGMFFHISFSVPNILLEIFMLLSGKAFLRGEYFCVV